MKTPTAVFVLLLLSFLLPSAVPAQQVDVTVMVNYEGIASANKDLLRDFASDVKTYLSNYNWGPGSTDEKIACTLNIFIQSVIGDNRYSAQVFIGSQRPIYKSTQSTAVTRLFDELWEFTYLRSRPLNHNPHTYDDLTSFLDFYIYLVLGYDYDTYDRLSGTPLFQKAADVASLGAASGQKGWQQSATTNFSRVQLIGEELNTLYEPVRAASYTYYFTGLDSMAFNKDRAFNNIISAIQAIGQVRKNADPRNMIIKVFFETKAKELADIFVTYGDPGVYSLLESIDPNHQKAYEDGKAKMGVK